MGITLYNNNRPHRVNLVSNGPHEISFDENNATIAVYDGAPITLRIGTSLPPGFSCRVVQYGIGTAMVVPRAGVTIINATTSTSAIGDMLELLCIAPFTFVCVKVSATGSGGGGGGGTGGGPIKAISANFTDATHLDSPLLVGQPLGIFWNEINRYLEPTEFAMTATGINILVPGFDATANSYTFYISIITNLPGLD